MGSQISSQVSLKSISSQGSSSGLGLQSALNSTTQINENNDQIIPEQTPEHPLSAHGMGGRYDPHYQSLWWIQTKILVFFSLGWIWTVGWIVLFLPLYSMPGNDMCLNAYMHVHIHAHIYACGHTCTHTCTHTCRHI